MSTSLLDLALSLLLGAAASVGQPANLATTGYLPVAEPAAQPVAESVAVRRQPRGARISLADPYYSFSRARRATRN